MWKKKFALLALIVVALVVVGVIVWPTPKEAKAEAVQYSVYCWWDNGGPETPIPADCNIQFNFRKTDVWPPEWSGWQTYTGYSYGVFSIINTADDPAYEWRIRIDPLHNEGEYEGIDPWGSPSPSLDEDDNSVEWQLAFPMR